ncbi:MAG: hypothetical protein P0S96_04565 [Simkaniaceae bacterium]|nr:hypothetical protein [Candidatus Sacchlamyda saccharinae]
MRNWIIQGLLVCMAFLAVERFCHKQTKGFRLQKIQAELPHNPDWETALPEDCDLQRLQNILSTPFYYLNSGGESYAFVSKDDQYVLKFFKLHHMRPKNLEDAFLPSPLRTKYQLLRTKKLTTLFSSCKLAYEKFRKGSGLVYLHLNATDHLKTKLTFYDAIGALHTLDLDSVPFALQEKAALAYPTITALAEAKELEAAKHRLSSLIELIKTRCQAGLSDHDPRARNFGFIGEEAIEFDLGSFSINEKLKQPQQIRKTLVHETLKLRRYLKKRHPELLNFFDEKMKQHLTEEI